MNDIRRCLLDIDVPGIRAAWAAMSPHLPQPASDAEALVALHHARTQAKSLPLKARAYSHRWLLDNGHPSGLPDALRPRAERLYPVVRDAVGIAVLGTSSLTREVAPIIRSAMSDAVAECYADGRKDAVPSRMKEARERTLRELLGRHR